MITLQKTNYGKYEDSEYFYFGYRVEQIWD